MADELHLPDEQNALPAPASPVERDSPALATDLEDSFFETRRLRKDGWDGEKMASFCGTLAETGVVTFACRASGMSAQSAYALRHRHPVFAKAWETAVAIARERLADELLARSLKGGAEQLLKDGCIVAERHTFDNKLAFAILRRLDHRAELGTTFRTPAAWEIPVPAPAIKGQWQDLLDALTDERNADAMRLLESPKVDSEVDNPPVEGGGSDSLDQLHVPNRVWQDRQSDEWRTDFPPPPDFDGEENGEWEDQDYSRSLTTDEYAALVGAGLAEPMPEDVTIDADEAERDAFFASLAAPVPPRSAQGQAGGGTKPRKPPKSEPPSTPNRSKGGASKPGENP